MQAWGEIVVCKVLNGVISEHTVETTRKCVVGNHVPGVRWHGFQPPASAVHCMITSKSQSLWASVLWCVNWWQQFSSPDKIPPSIGGYLLIPPTLSNLVFQEDNRKRFMEMLAKDPPTVTFLPGQASFPKAQKKIASMLYLIHWTDAKKKKNPTVYQTERWPWDVFNPRRTPNSNQVMASLHDKYWGRDGFFRNWGPEKVCPTTWHLGLDFKDYYHIPRQWMKEHRVKRHEGMKGS